MIQRDNIIIQYVNDRLFFMVDLPALCVMCIVNCDDFDEKDTIMNIIWEKSTKILVQIVATYYNK